VSGDVETIRSSDGLIGTARIALGEDLPMNAAAMRLVLPVASLLLLSGAAHGGLLASALDAVEVSVPPNAQVPIWLSFTDEDGARQTLADSMEGRPALLILADYTCDSLCGPVLALAAAALDRSGLEPGEDYRVVAIGLDPNGRTGDARAMKRAQIGESGPLTQATAFLTADATVLGQIAASLGYHSIYDAENRQFAHSAVAFVLMADGRVARILSGLALDPVDLRLALVEAGAGRSGNLADRVRLLCYGFDPAAGIYTLSVHRVVGLLSLLTAAGLACVLGAMLCKERADLS
jgi:protein SCO1